MTAEVAVDRRATEIPALGDRGLPAELILPHTGATSSG
jgi:hypothetical protein